MPHARQERVTCHGYLCRARGYDRQEDPEPVWSGPALSEIVRPMGR